MPSSIQDREEETISKMQSLINAQRKTSARIPTKSLPRQSSDIFRPLSIRNDDAAFSSERRIFLSSPLCRVHSTDKDSLGLSVKHDVSTNNIENRISRLDVFNSLSKDLSKSTFTNTLLEEFRVSIKRGEGCEGETIDRGYHIVCDSPKIALEAYRFSGDQ
jgi:hypothetical protein